MSTPARAYASRAIVLRARNLGEADKIFTLFTDARGKLDAVGKGVRRANSRLSGKLEFGSEATLTLHRGRNLDVITSASLEREYWSALVEPARFATAHLVAELIDAFCEQDLALPDVWMLLRGVIGAIARSDDPASLVPRFELRLLGALGLGPVAEACVRCDVPLARTAAWADIEAGGLACANCRPHGADVTALAPDDVENFAAIAAAPQAGVRSVLRATLPVTRAVDAFVTWHLGKRTKSSKLLVDLAPT